MTKSLGLMVALSVLAALAMPLSADARGQAGGGGHGGGGHSFGGGGHSFGGGGHSFGGGGVRSFGSGSSFRSFGGGSLRSFGGSGPRYLSGGSRPAFRSYGLHSGGHYRSVNRGITSTRSVQRSQNLRMNQTSSRQLRLQQRAARTQQLRSTVTPTSSLRRSGQARITTQAARQGRFSSAFASHGGTGHHHHHPRYAWRHGWYAGFVPWYGPVFWPYAYFDLFYYPFWPYGYDDGYWFYAYDDFFDGVFWGELGPPETYGYASRSEPRPRYATVQELCNQPGTGVTAWPFAEIERKVGLSDEQKQLLSDVRKAAGDAAASFKASCPAENTFPLTPPGRLAAMTARLDATLQAVQTVRPALEKFYDSLTDEQKERFNTIGPKKPGSSEARQALASAKSCKEQKPGLTNLPIERIEDAVKPTDAQQASLKALEDATTKAVWILQAVCPDETPITPPGRLQAMETRLKAMVEAANTVKPALEDFYGLLSAEQKARFNRIGQTLAQATE